MDNDLEKLIKDAEGILGSGKTMSVKGIEYEAMVNGTIPGVTKARAAHIGGAIVMHMCVEPKFIERMYGASNSGCYDGLVEVVDFSREIPGVKHEYDLGIRFNHSKILSASEVMQMYFKEVARP